MSFYTINKRELVNIFLIANETLFMEQSEYKISLVVNLRKFIG